MLQRLRPSSLAILLVGLTGCASYRPMPLDPEADLRDLRQRDLHQFVVERARPGQRSGPPVEGFDPLDGLDEAEVVAVALTLNPELRVRRAETGEARAALITAGLWPNPEVGVNPQWGVGGASGVAVEADALFQLLRPGERDARRQAARALVDEVDAEVVADEFRLVAEVRTQHLSVLAAERSVALLQQGVALRERARDLVRQQRKLGEATELEISTTELEVAQAQRELRQARIELGREGRELNRVMGLPPEYATRLTGLGEPLKITMFEDITDEELDRFLLTGRPELRAGEAAYRRAEQELRLAVIAQYPRLGLGPAFEKELDGDKALGLALSLELPVFNQNQGEIAERRAARERARATYVALLHRLTADSFAARADVRAARQEVEAQEREVLPLLRRNQELFEGAFKARELNIIDWITAQRRAVDAQREYAESLVRYQQAVIRLETATGHSPTQPARGGPSSRPAAATQPSADARAGKPSAAGSARTRTQSKSNRRSS